MYSTAWVAVHISICCRLVESCNCARYCKASHRVFVSWWPFALFTFQLRFFDASQYSKSMPSFEVCWLGHFLLHTFVFSGQMSLVGGCVMC